MQRIKCIINYCSCTIYFLSVVIDCFLNPLGTESNSSDVYSDYHL